MKKQIRTLLLLAALASYGLPTLAQSTQGTDFWVSSGIVCSSDNGQGITPYIAVSAEKACTVTITDYQGNSVLQTNAGGTVLPNISVSAGSWTEFGTKVNSNPSAGPIQVYLEPAKWYPINTKEPAKVGDDLAGKKFNYGLHITATENISVYVILSGASSMDASNILPVTALGSEYYVQDYTPEAHSGGGSWSTNEGNVVTVTAILGTENNTTVDIIPRGETYDGHSSAYNISLNQGDVYYLVSKKMQQLAGTHIIARDGRKIAIYTSLPLTRLPNEVTARDALFEQPLPVEYWGTQFIVTRSLGKNGNLIGITATQPTSISVDGTEYATIYEGDTYYIMLQNAGNPQATSKAGSSHVDAAIIGDAIYIETSCPCAVYNYDTGNTYAGSIDEVDRKKGDPSSVWVSPVQQKIDNITFGTCYTDNTKDHFLNVVTETATCQNTKLTALNGASTLDKTSLLNWNTVPGKPEYSYARAKIGDASTNQYSVFRLENQNKFIATVYGNGTNESYAYSAGSSAVVQGVDVNGTTFTNGYFSDKKFCLDTLLKFDANVGTDEITSVNWTFGDGTSEYGGLPQTEHTYTTYGWKDVTAELYGRQVCSEEDNQYLGTVEFHFIIAHPNTFINQPEHHCITIDGKLSDGTQLTEERIAYLIEHGDNDTTQADCASDIYITPVSYGRDIEEQLDTIFGFNIVNDRNGDPHSISKDMVDTIPASGKNCMRIQKYRVEVIACLDMEITQPQSVCLSEKMKIDYQKYKGEILSARFVVPSEGIDEEVAIDNDWVELSLPTDSIKTPGYYQGELIVRPWIPEKYKEQLIAQGEHCDSLVFPIAITVNYPSDIFKFKFNNVLAVYKPGFGGNTDYQFSHYEWHLVRNAQDTLLAEGEDLSVFYLGQGIPFEEGDAVYVVLTDDSGMKLSSCPQTLRDIQKDYSTQSKPSPAQKKIVNRQFVIIRGDDMFDIYGQRVK